MQHQQEPNPHLIIDYKPTQNIYIIAYSLFIPWCVTVAAASAGVRQPPSHISPKPVVFFLTFP